MRAFGRAHRRRLGAMGETWALGAWITLTLGIALGDLVGLYELELRATYWFWDGGDTLAAASWRAPPVAHAVVVCERRRDGEPGPCSWLLLPSA